MPNPGITPSPSDAFAAAFFETAPGRDKLNDKVMVC
jgi:hypothetical protein